MVSGSLTRHHLKWWFLRYMGQMSGVELEAQAEKIRRTSLYLTACVEKCCKHSLTPEGLLLLYLAHMIGAQTLISSGRLKSNQECCTTI